MFLLAVLALVCLACSKSLLFRVVGNLFGFVSILFLVPFDFALGVIEIVAVNTDKYLKSWTIEKIDASRFRENFSWPRFLKVDVLVYSF